MWSLGNSGKLQLVSSSLRNVGYYATELSVLFRNSQFIIATRSLSSVEGSGKLEGKKHSFTVSYLVKSCGLSLESAKSRSKYVTLYSTEKPNSVLELLKSQGFTDNQITKTVKSLPEVLTYQVETLLPKLKFFGSIGFSSTETAEIISSCPKTLGRSLHNSIIPCYDFLKSVLTQDCIVKRCLKQSSWILQLNMEKELAPKVSCLKSHGVPQAHLEHLFSSAPRLVAISPSTFNKTVEKVNSLGFDPSKVYFVQAVAVFSQMRESTWERKFELYKLCGWSEEDLKSAFQKHPLCMKMSDQKIKKTMDFLVKSVGLKPSFIAKCAMILRLNFEKRIVPRCLAIAVLLSQGILKAENVNHIAVLKMSDKQFEEKFVIKYQNDVPQMLSIFQGKLGPQDLGFFEEILESEPQST